MAIAPAVLQGGVVLGTSAAAIYTCPAATRAVIKRAVFTNSTASAVTFTVTVARGGGSALAIIWTKTLAANSADTAPELSNLVLAATDVVSAFASAGTSVNAFLSGYTM